MVKIGEVKLVVDEVVQGELEGAGLDLFGKYHRDELTWDRGIRFIFSHCNTSC